MQQAGFANSYSVDSRVKCDFEMRVMRNERKGWIGAKYAPVLPIITILASTPWSYLDLGKGSRREYSTIKRVGDDKGVAGGGRKAARAGRRKGKRMVAGQVKWPLLRRVLALASSNTSQATCAR